MLGAVSKMLRRLLVALAVLVMPLGMHPAAGAPIVRHSAAMPMSMPMQHCPEQGSKHHTNGAFAECTMACSSALPAADSVRQEPAGFHRSPVAPAAVDVLDGLHPDIATPPPKRA
jgi:hypothetical protein